MSEDLCNKRSIAVPSGDREVDELVRELGLMLGIPSDDPEWLSRKLVDQISRVLNPKAIRGLPRGPNERFAKITRLADEVHRIVYAYLVPQGCFRVTQRGRPRAKGERDKEILELARRTGNAKSLTLGQIARKMNARHGLSLTPQAVARVLARATAMEKRDERFHSEVLEPLFVKIRNRLGSPDDPKSRRRR
jgi:hypothetical protein